MNYYNDFNQHKKSDTVKWIVAFVLIAVLFVGLVANIFIMLRPDIIEQPPAQTETTGSNENENKTDNTDNINPVEPTQASANTSGGVTNLEGEEMVSKKVYAMSKSMTFSSPSANSRSAPSGVTLEATVSPVSATDKTVDWTVEFVDSTLEWAVDKVVTDYITVTPESDGSNIATVVCHQPFQAPIQIIVTSRSNPNAFAKCLVDYRAKIAIISVSGMGDNIESGSLIFCNSQYVDEAEAGETTGTIYINPLDTSTLSPNYRVMPTNGTVGQLDITRIPDDYHVDMKMTMAPEFLQALNSAGFTITNANGYVFINGGVNSGISNSVTGSLGFLSKIITLLSNCTNYDALSEEEQNEMMNFVITYNTTRAFILQVGYTDSAVEEINEFLDTSCDIYLYPQVTNVYLNNGNLEF